MLEQQQKYSTPCVFVAIKGFSRNEATIRAFVRMSVAQSIHPPVRPVILPVRGSVHRLLWLVDPELEQQQKVFHSMRFSLRLLVANRRLYKSTCPYVGRSDHQFFRWSVQWPICDAFVILLLFGLRPNSSSISGSNKWPCIRPHFWAAAI